MSPSLLTITSKGGASARGTITVTNRDPSPHSHTVSDAVGPYFSNPAGTFPLPANGRHQIPVQFAGVAAATSSVRIEVDDGRRFTVPVTGTVNLGDGQPF